ncbi:MAG TPA: hypothetical protein VFS43_30040 [Polyangiaceae bacterium]|nr:hypothetical protein [Polyangiaceae bacterium]
MNDILVRALFDSPAKADGGLKALRANGVAGGDVSVIVSEHTHRALGEDFETTSVSKAAEGAGVGGAIGGVAGATIGAIVAIGSNLVVPGLGVVIAGPIAAALAGAGAGGLAGTMVGALVGAGVPEEHATVFEAGVRKGGVMMVVRAHTPAEASTIEAALRANGAEQTSLQSN